MKTVVLGLGNPILGDDGVGLRVARAVDHRRERRPTPFVQGTQRSARPLGRCDEIVAVAKGRPLDLAISPFAFELTEEDKKKGLTEKSPAWRNRCGPFDRIIARRLTA